MNKEKLYLIIVLLITLITFSNCSNMGFVGYGGRMPEEMYTYEQDGKLKANVFGATVDAAYVPEDDELTQATNHPSPTPSYAPSFGSYYAPMQVNPYQVPASAY